MRYHNSLWRYPHNDVNDDEMFTIQYIPSDLNMRLTDEEIRVALHIIKYYNQKNIPISTNQIKLYIDNLICHVNSDFLLLYAEDDLDDHLAINILMSYTMVERIIICKCLEHMRSVCKKYPNERDFPYMILLMEAHAIDTSKISKNNYEIIRKAIDPKCKNFHVNILLVSIVHISHNIDSNTNLYPITLETFTCQNKYMRICSTHEELIMIRIKNLFESVHFQFMLLLNDCNPVYQPLVNLQLESVVNDDSKVCQISKSYISKISDDINDNDFSNDGVDIIDDTDDDDFIDDDDDIMIDTTQYSDSEKEDTKHSLYDLMVSWIHTFE